MSSKGNVRKTFGWRQEAMNTYQIQSQLSHAVRTAALLQAELAAQNCSFVGRLFRKIRHAYLQSCIESLTFRLRGRY